MRRRFTSGLGGELAVDDCAHVLRISSNLSELVGLLLNRRHVALFTRDAKQHEKVWEFWRQLVFLGATTVFFAGLLMMGMVGELIERAISLLIVAIVTYSLFVGGSIWS